MPDDPKKNAWQSSSMFSGIFSEIPKTHLTIDNIVQISWMIVRHLYGIVRHFFFGSLGIFFWIVRHFFGIPRLFWGNKKGKKLCNRGGFKVMSGVFVLSKVNMWYRSQYSDNVNHPFNTGRTGKKIPRILQRNWGQFYQQIQHSYRDMNKKPLLTKVK